MCEVSPMAAVTLDGDMHDMSSTLWLRYSTNRHCGSLDKRPAAKLTILICHA